MQKYKIILTQKERRMWKVNATVHSYVMVCQNRWFTTISLDNYTDRSIYCFNIFFLNTASHSICYYKRQALSSCNPLSHNTLYIYRVAARLCSLEALSHQSNAQIQTGCPCSLLDGPCGAASHKIANTTLHAKWNHQAATLEAIFKAQRYTDCHLPVISTYINGRPKLHLVNLLSMYYTSKFASNTKEIKLMEHEA